MRLPGKSLFSSQKTPSIEPLPELPDRSGEEAARARKEAELASKRRRGRPSTRLSGGLGDTSVANVDRPELRTRLGG